MAAPTNPVAPTLPFAKVIPEVLLFGDSITQRAHNIWADSLSDWGSRKFEVRVKGFGGYNSAWGRAAMAEMIKTGAWGTPRLVTIFFGANDAVDPNSASRVLAVDIEAYKANLRAMVAKARSVHYPTDSGPKTPCVVLITPPPFDAKKNGNNMRSLENARRYAEAVVTVAREPAVSAPVIDLFNVLLSHRNWPDYLDDGLHLSKLGGDELVDQLKQLIHADPNLADLDRKPNDVLTDPAAIELPDWSVLSPDFETYLKQFGIGPSDL